MRSTITRRVLPAATIVVALQTALAWGTFRDPFLDAAYHYFYDNAWFTTAARNANRIGFPENRLGVVIALPHDRWNEPCGPPAFYTHHPYLMKLLMQQCMAVCGHEEWVSRAFSLGLSIVASLGMLTTITMLTGSVVSGMVAAVVFVGLPVMAVYQTCVKFEIDGMAMSAWLFPAILLYVRRPHAGRGVMLAAVGLACGLSAWTGLLFAVLACATLLLPIARHRKITLADPQTCAALWLGGSLLAAGGLLLAAFTWQKGGFVAFAHDLAAAFRIHADRTVFSPEQWIARQRHYLWANYGPFGLILLAAAAAALVFRSTARSRGACRDRPTGDPALLDSFTIASLATPLIWVATFREGSYVHEYWSIGLCMPIATAMPLSISLLPASRRTPCLFAAVLIAGLVYCAGWQALAGRLVFFRDEAVAADVAFLKSLRDERCVEFVYVALNDHAFNSWFHPRLFEYYTDRSLRFLRKGERLRPDQMALLLTFTDQAGAEAFVEQNAMCRLRLRACGPRFCAYEVVDHAAVVTP